MNRLFLLLMGELRRKSHRWTRETCLFRGACKSLGMHIFKPTFLIHADLHFVGSEAICRSFGN